MPAELRHAVADADRQTVAPAEARAVTTCAGLFEDRLNLDKLRFRRACPHPPDDLPLFARPHSVAHAPFEGRLEKAVFLPAVIFGDDRLNHTETRLGMGFEVDEIQVGKGKQVAGADGQKKARCQYLQW